MSESVLKGSGEHNELPSISNIMWLLNFVLVPYDNDHVHTNSGQILDFLVLLFIPLTTFFLFYCCDRPRVRMMAARVAGG